MTFPLILGGDFILKMTDEELAQFSKQNKPYKFEKEADGSLMVSEPTFLPSDQQNNEIIYQLTTWNKQYNLGVIAGCNTAFYLQDGSLRSPDAAWISNKRYESLQESDRKGFPSICPDFIIELRSSSDPLSALKIKMELWMKNGCRLAWLIDPKSETVHIYTEAEQNIHQGFEKPISADPVLPGFQLILSEL